MLGYLSPSSGELAIANLRFLMGHKTGPVTNWVPFELSLHRQRHDVTYQKQKQKQKLSSTRTERNMAPVTHALIFEVQQGLAKVDLA